MTSIFTIDEYNDMWQMLPGGVQILARHRYSQPEARGVLAVSIAAIVSILAILSLFIAIGVSFLKCWRNPPEKVDCRQTFIKSHAGIYFLCMLVTTLTFTIGFMLSIVWAVQDEINFGPFCTLQAVLKQFGNVATALWVLAIAVHTFVAVFLEMKVSNLVFYIVFCAVWLLSGCIVAVGPLFYTTERLGPWYGISAQWCWTSDTYATPRFATEYLWMFIAAGISFLLYTLLFLKLRGYMGSDFRFTSRARPIGVTAARVANQMLWYPVVYTISVFPIAGCRIYELQTSQMSNLDLKMGSAVVFVLSGLVNVILYTFTRNILPVGSIFSKLSWRAKSKFQRLSYSTGSPNIPEFRKDSSLLEKSTSRGSPTTEVSSPGSWPTSAQSERAAANPFADAGIEIVVTSPVPSYQPKNDEKRRSVSLVKSNSISSLRSTGSRKGSVGPAKNGRTVIKKPNPVALSKERRSYESNSGLEQGTPPRFSPSLDV